MKFATKPCEITHLTLCMSLHYLGKLNIQIYLADIEENGWDVDKKFVFERVHSKEVDIRISELKNTLRQLMIKVLSYEDKPQTHRTVREKFVC